MTGGYVLAAVFVGLLYTPSVAADTDPLPPCLRAPPQTAPEAQAALIIHKAADGDTLIAEGGSKIRLAAIRAPKHTATRWQLRAAPYSRIATQTLSSLVEGKTVMLADGHKQDRYGRLLAHVILRTDDGGTLWLQKHLVSQGLVRVDLSQRNQDCGPVLLEAEEKARQAQKGLWGSFILSDSPT